MGNLKHIGYIYEPVPRVRYAPFLFTTKLLMFTSLNWVNVIDEESEACLDMLIQARSRCNVTLLIICLGFFNSSLIVWKERFWAEHESAVRPIELDSFYN